VGLAMRYVPALDGLRALAVLLVFLYHRSGYFPGGWIGVDIFFVLSGYLITSVLVGEHETTGVISLRRFYIRRVCRLLPALVVVVCVAVAMALWFHSKRRDTEIDAAAALLYLSDYRYALFPVHGTALGHTWSLSVEEQFYLFWPLLLIVLLTWNRRVALRATLVLIVVVAVWRGFLLVISDDPFSRTYFAFDARADELLIGCALALWQPQIMTSRFLTHIWPVVVLLLTAVALKVSPSGPSLKYIDTIGYPLFGVAAAYLIVILTSDEKSYLTYLLSLPLIVAFGRISYGFYLWHYLIIHAQGYIIINRIWITFVLTLAAAVASYWLIERPFLKLGHLGVSPLRPLLIIPLPSKSEGDGEGARESGRFSVLTLWWLALAALGRVGCR
jgi:peptidoglycan/LPS O-acetylase OafA/YrhL